MAGGAVGVKELFLPHAEGSAAYFRLPMRHYTPFVLAGVGGLVFDPKDFVGAGTQARAAFVYGGGADFNLTRHIFVRAEYRGLVYNSPTYGLPVLAGARSRNAHRAEPLDRFQVASGSRRTGDFVTRTGRKASLASGREQRTSTKAREVTIDVE